MPTKAPIVAVITQGRTNITMPMTFIRKALSEVGISNVTQGGPFWDKAMNGLLDYGRQHADMVLTIDSDSIFTAKNIRELVTEFDAHPELAALAPMQVRRGSKELLVNTGQKGKIDTDGQPMPAKHMHFGMTLIRSSWIDRMSRPLFRSVPDSTGRVEGSEPRGKPTWRTRWLAMRGIEDVPVDADIYFWANLRAIGGKIAMSTKVAIGHCEEVFAFPCYDGSVAYLSAKEWQALAASGSDHVIL